MEDHATIRTRLGHARQHFRARIDGVQRRLTRARSYAADPWVQFGAALAVGYLMGRAERAETIARKPETIAHAVVRAAVVPFVTAAVRRAMSEPTG